MDFSLIDRIRGGEEIALSDFTTGEDEITRQVIEYGGLFPFNVARLQKKVFLPPIKGADRSVRPTRAMTLAEKIFARHMAAPDGTVGVAAVRPSDTGFTRVDLRFSHEYVTPMAAIFYEQYVGKDVRRPGYQIYTADWPGERRDLHPGGLICANGPCRSFRSSQGKMVS